VRLFPECSYLPAVYRRWTIDNHAPYEVTVTWRIDGSPQTGTLTIPANTSVFLNTRTVPGAPNTLILEVDGVPIATSASDPAQCAAPPVPPPVPSPPPTGTGGELPGLPNTGTGQDGTLAADARLAGAVGALALLGAAAVVAGGWRRRRRSRPT
jgi:hypothetical protein